MTDSSSNQKLFFDRNLKIIYLITLMAVLGVSSITPAFPKITRELNISAEAIGLLIILFTLPGVLLTPVLGVAADRIGRKIIMIPSLFLFGIAGFLCAFAPTFELLLIFRFLQGVGAASLGSLNVTLIGDLFKGKDRVTAMGFNASVLSIATASYPFIGGLLANISWHMPFFLPIFAIPVALLVLYKLDNPEPKVTQNLKLYLKTAFAGIKDKNALILFLGSVVTFILLYGSFLTYIPIFLDRRFASEPIMIGIMMSIMSITTGIVSSQLGRFSRSFGEKKLIIFSYLVYGFALFIIPFIDTFWSLSFVVVLYGIGQGLNIPSVQSLLASIAPMEYRAAFMSMNGMLLRLGQTLGPVIMGLVYVFGNLNWVFFAGTIFALLMIIPFMLFRAED
ncbi:MAG: MFS transporter [Melioribacteraceae bacterium]|nr:MFS transporter [Melioribacteraceae bacterium]MCF8353267.1 MFS transporter [Melioribacteraceae bacterium]MCF8394847.1 MFS transporter [Melioribacteraceae bacterium]MCF8418794.1 MFS transporter [Melioribacteraceae bacterium]